MDLKQKTQLGFSINGKLVANATNTLIFSKKYVHIMVNASIFNILCRRIPINEKEIEPKTYEGVPYAIIAKVKKIKDPIVALFLSWTKGIKDAINKNYLKAIFIYFKNSNNDIIENYSLHLKYNTDPNYHNPNKQTPGYVNYATKALLEAIAELPDQKLGDDSRVVIEFTYTNDTPPDYEPPGFEVAEEPNCFKFRDNSILLASVSTGFHKLTARCSQRPVLPPICTPPICLIDEHERVLTAEEAEPENSSQIINLIDSPNRKRKIIDVNDDNDQQFIEENGKISDKQISKKKITTSDITISERNDGSSISDFGSSEAIDSNYVNCICMLRFSTSVELIKCSKCEKQFHGLCYGFIDCSHSENFICIDCGAIEGIMNNCKTDNEKRLLAKIRLMTYFIAQHNRIPDDILDSMTEEEQADVVARLKYNGSISNSRAKDFRKSKFNQIKARNMIPHLFTNADDSQYLI